MFRFVLIRELFLSEDPRYVELSSGKLVKEYHDDLTKDALETIIPLCEDTLDDEDFNDESTPETITQTCIQKSTTI